MPFYRSAVPSRYTPYKTVYRHAALPYDARDEAESATQRGGVFARPYYPSNYYVPSTRASRRLNSKATSLGLEHKYVDSFVTVQDLEFSDNGSLGNQSPQTLNCFNGIVQGSARDQRTGRTVTLTSLDVRGQLNWGSSNNPGTADIAFTPVVYMAVVLDMKPRQTVFASEDAFVNPAASDATCAVPLYNLLNSTRFRVLWHSTFVCPVRDIQVGDGGLFLYGNLRTPFRAFLKMNIVTNYLDGGGTETSIQDNALYFVGWWSPSLDGTPVAPAISYNARMRFRG